jgi:hypothetical protein
MSKAWKIAFCAGLIFLAACENPSVVDVSGGGVERGDYDLKPPPVEVPTDPVPEPRPLPPETQTDMLKARNLTSSERKSNVTPYRTATVKTIDLGKAVKSKDCIDGFEDVCIKNRQVLFALDLGPFLDQLSGRDLFDIELEADYYSIGQNYRTELICLLNNRRCSGRAIIRFPRIGLPFLAKMMWWRPPFWDEGIDQVVVNEHFHFLLSEGYDENRGFYQRQNVRIPLADLLGMHLDELVDLAKSEGTLYFSVTDDTFILRPKLLIHTLQ